MTDLDLDRLLARADASEEEVESLGHEWGGELPTPVVAVRTTELRALIDRLTAAEKEAAEWRRIMARPHPGDACWGAHQQRSQDSCLGCERDAALARAEAAEAEAVRLRREVARHEADFPCDQGCTALGYPDEVCSRHGRKPADLWERGDVIAKQRDAATARAEAAEARLAWLRTPEAVEAVAATLLDEPGLAFVKYPGVTVYPGDSTHLAAAALRALTARTDEETDR